MPEEPLVTIVIPTRNAGGEFPAVLDAMRHQRLDRPPELLIVDSGSTDGTADAARAAGARVIPIATAEFDHGLTRARAIQEARGDIVLLTVQDAMPADEHWAARLLDAFADPRVAGAYSRQVPRSDAPPFVRARLAGWLAAEPDRRVQAIDDPAAFDRLAPPGKLRVIGFDNVSAAVRREVALAIPFRACAFGEDLDWSLRVLRAGHRLVYEPRSVVVHSHDRSIGEEFRRVRLDHANLHRLIGLRTVPHVGSLIWQSAGGAVRLARAVARDRDLSFAGRLRWWALAAPHGVSQTLAQYLGARDTMRRAGK